MTAPRYTIHHEWSLATDGRVDVYVAFEKEWDLDMPVGRGATEAAAIADLQEKIEEREGAWIK